MSLEPSASTRKLASSKASTRARRCPRCACRTKKKPITAISITSASTNDIRKIAALRHGASNSSYCTVASRISGNRSLRLKKLTRCIPVTSAMKW